MNTLERTVIDQFHRVRAAGEQGHEVLAETQGEILQVATLDQVFEIIEADSAKIPDSEKRSSNSIIRSQQDPRSIRNRLSQPIRTGHGLARIGFLEDRQGYAGGLILDGDDVIVHGSAMSFRRRDDDPIQDAMGDVVYPAMMWAKAIRAEAYRNRPEEDLVLTVSDYLIKHGLSLGCHVAINGDLLGATGLMPGERMWGVMDDPEVAEHVHSEGIEPFRLSGLCDQAVVDEEILTRTGDYVADVLAKGGSLN